MQTRSWSTYAGQHTFDLNAVTLDLPALSTPLDSWLPINCGFSSRMSLAECLPLGYGGRLQNVAATWPAVRLHALQMPILSCVVA